MADQPGHVYLSTNEAAQRMGVPVDLVRKLCAAGRLAGALQGRKNGPWRIPEQAVDAWLGQSRWRRKLDSSGTSFLGLAADLIAVLSFAYSLFRLVTGQSMERLWVLLLVVSVVIVGGSLAVLQLHKKAEALNFSASNRPRLYEAKWLKNKLVVRIARWVAIGLTVGWVAVGIGYYGWWMVPAQQTVVLVADFVGPTGVDSARVTQTLVENLKVQLSDHQKDISVKRLNEVIPAEGGSERARAIGQRPEHKAAFVVWGDYVLVPEPELYVHFDLMEGETALGSGVYEQYGPGQVQQPTMFEFKVALGEHLGQLVAFASGLALFEANEDLAAITYFETAARGLGQALTQEWGMAIRFYRGTAYIALGEALKARPDLELVVDGLAVDQGASQGFRSAALGNLGLVARRLGEYEAARSYHEQALAISQAIGDRANEANQLGNLGIVAWSLGEYEAARSYLEQALAISQAIGDRESEGAALGNLGSVALSLGEYEAARPYHEQALAISRAIGDRESEAYQLGNLGLVALGLGEYETSRSYHEQALAISQAIGDRESEANQLGNLGLVALSLGEYEAARAYLEDALAISRAMGNRSGEGADLGNLGSVALSLGEYEAARSYLEQALAISQAIGNRSGEGAALGNLGLVALSLGEYEAARSYLEQALAISQTIGERESEANQLGNLGSVALSLGEYEAARSYLEEALALYEALGVPVPAAVTNGLERLESGK